MASKKVSLLKFVGTVSVGLLTGVSYTLSSLTVPALLTLPSASAASRAFHSLLQTATPHLRALSFLSTSTFALAFVLSPRAHRHPYLLYTSLLSLASSFAPRIAPALLGASSAQTQTQTRTTTTTKRKTTRTMEASYEVLGDAHSEATSASGEEIDEELVNGEGVRGEVEDWLKARVVQTGIAAVGFMISVVGIWGDGAAQVFGGEIIVL